MLSRYSPTERQVSLQNGSTSIILDEPLCIENTSWDNKNPHAICFMENQSDYRLLRRT